MVQRMVLYSRVYNSARNSPFTHKHTFPNTANSGRRMKLGNLNLT